MEGTGLGRWVGLVLRLMDDGVSRVSDSRVARIFVQGQVEIV